MPSRKIPPGSLVSRSAEALHRVLDGEAVVVDLAGGAFFGLDEVGTCIWEGIEGEVPVESLVDRVTAAFEVPREKARTDLVGFLRTLADRGLVRVRTPSP